MTYEDERKEIAKCKDLRAAADNSKVSCLLNVIMENKETVFRDNWQNI